MGHSQVESLDLPTPPVIYSISSRRKLVFLVEALPQAPSRLKVGQPVDVRPIAKREPSS